MKIRKLLIIIVSVIILLMFGLVLYVSYNMGINYGEQNAETIRESNARKAEQDLAQDLANELDEAQQIENLEKREKKKQTIKDK